jgi:hypothetical protein
MVLDPEQLEVATDRLLQQWLREMSTPDRSILGSSGYSGEPLAITETRNHRSRPRSSKSEEGSARVHATETRSGKASTIKISSSTARMEAVMAKLMRINIFAYNALCLHYTGMSYSEIARELNCSKEYARRYKLIGFDMVMMEVDNFPRELLT